MSETKKSVIQAELKKNIAIAKLINYRICIID